MATDNRLDIIELLFPQYDLTEVAANYAGYSTEELIDWILQNAKKIPVKKQQLKRSQSLRTIKSEAAKTIYSEMVENSLNKSFISRFISRIFRWVYSIFRRFEEKSNSELTCGTCFDGLERENAISCNGASMEIHFFCHKCIREQAKAVTEFAPMADGGCGFKCMEYNCENIILLSEIKQFIPRTIRKRIDDRILEETLGNCGIKFERCQACNFAVEMNVSTKVNKVFNCLKCHKNWCRICENEWDDDHFGITCREYLKNKGENAKKRILEKKMNEAVVRKCEKCNFQFVKAQGCNKVVCRCGVAYCYICRIKDINYDHFCKCVGNIGACVCGKCRLHMEANEIHEKEIKQVTANFKR
uniref:RING-type domain-containing protein n=1 Tax=Panagrolaimus superbus TaxID=310955 RepID=A0A914YC40_9BILA